MPEIWNLAKNVVPLQSIREMLCECGLRLSIALSELGSAFALHHPCIVKKEREARVANGDKRREAATRCSWSQVNLIPCKTHFRL